MPKGEEARASLSNYREYLRRVHGGQVPMRDERQDAFRQAARKLAAGTRTQVPRRPRDRDKVSSS